MRQLLTGLRHVVHDRLLPLAGRLCARSAMIPVIYYHDVVPDDTAYSFQRTGVTAFEAQLRYLAEQGYRTYRFDELPADFRKQRQAREVLITFDDGFLSNYSVVYPLMRRYGLRWNIYLSAGYMNEDTPGYLTWAMVREMADSGEVGFGAHTYSHLDTRLITDANFDDEITRTNALIAQHAGRPARDFCFPYGYYNADCIERLAASAAYARLYTSDTIKLALIRETRVVGRTGIHAAYDLCKFADILNGYYNSLYYYEGLRRGFPSVTRGS